jgi:hypothetical protein
MQTLLIFSSLILCIIIVIMVSVLQKRVNFENTHTKGLGIISMIKDPKNICTWLQHHRDLGIRKFYIRLEDTQGLVSYLDSQSDVHIKIGKSSGVNEYEEIQTRQNNWVNEALKLGRDDGIKWLVHIDADELLSGEISEILNLPPTTRTFWMQNKEAKFAKVPGKKDNCFVASKVVDCGERNNSCVAYQNGKSGGRTERDVKAHGPHRMISSTGTPDVKLKKVFVLHYESCDFDIFKNKFKGLSVQNKKVPIPFPYYNDSIAAAKKNDEKKLYSIYKKYRVEK